MELLVLSCTGPCLGVCGVWAPLPPVTSCSSSAWHWLGRGAVSEWWSELERRNPGLFITHVLGVSAFDHEPGHLQQLPIPSGPKQTSWLGWVMVPTLWDIPGSHVEGAGFAGEWSRHLCREIGELGVRKVPLNGEYRL